jgi:hypothetical protein
MEVYYDYPNGSGEDVFKVYLTSKDIEWLKTGKEFLSLYKGKKQGIEPTVDFLDKFIEGVNT